MDHTFPFHPTLIQQWIMVHRWPKSDNQNKGAHDITICQPTVWLWLALYSGPYVTGTCVLATWSGPPLDRNSLPTNFSNKHLRKKILQRLVKQPIFTLLCSSMGTEFLKSFNPCCLLLKSPGWWNVLNLKTLWQLTITLSHFLWFVLVQPAHFGTACSPKFCFQLTYVKLWKQKPSCWKTHFQHFHRDIIKFLAKTLRWLTLLLYKLSAYNWFTLFCSTRKRSNWIKNCQSSQEISRKLDNCCRETTAGSVSQCGHFQKSPLSRSVWNIARSESTSTEFRQIEAKMREEGT